MAEDSIVVNKEGPIAMVIINRPEVMNAVNGEIQSQLLNAFEWLAADGEVRVIILEGAGGNFSVGADMTLLHESFDVYQTYDVLKNGIGKLITSMRATPQPVICKVRGNVYGGGMGLALAGDFVIASENSRFCEAFVNIGVTLDGGASYFLPRLIGMARARELAFLGNAVSGKDAAAMGLIYRAVPERSLDAEVSALAQVLLRKSPQALASIKDTLEDTFDRSLKEALEWEASHQAIMLQSKEHKEAVRRFLNSHNKNRFI